MSEKPYDFAVVGTVPLARLIAALLAGSHGKSVLFQGESQSGYRLSRGIDLSVAPLTRPETWTLLRGLVPETLKAIGRGGGRRSWTRIDPIFFADADHYREALGHVRHMTAAFGIASERVSTRNLGPGREGYVLRDCVLLHRPVLEPALDTMMQKAGVYRLDDSVPLQVAADGSARARVGEETVLARQTILVGDSALLRHLQESAWPSILARETTSTILTEPTELIASPVMHQLDHRLSLLQPAARGLSAIGPGEIDAFTATLRNLLGSSRSFRQAGQSSYLRVVTRDGGPAVGRVNGVGPDVVAGLGMTGLFFAPALARWLAGSASAPEQLWLEARLVDRLAESSLVGEAGGPI